MAPKKHILLISDEQNDGGEIQRLLQNAGMTVDTAPPGEQTGGPETADEYDVVVLHMLVPGENTPDTIKRLREIYHRSEIVVLSAHASVETALRCMEAGAFDYIIESKSEDIASRIQDAMEKWGSQLSDSPSGVIT